MGWEAQLAKAKQYKRRHGDCNVPQGWAEDPKLGSWVNRQRQRKKSTTAARVANLEALGFAWCSLDAGPTVAETDAELRRLKLPTNGSNERGRKLRVARGAERLPWTCDSYPFGPQSACNLM